MNILVSPRGLPKADSFSNRSFPGYFSPTRSGSNPQVSLSRHCSVA